MSGDLLSELKNNRHRALVPERSDPLISANAPSNSTGDTQNPPPPKARRNKSATSSYPGDLRRLTIRIDESISFKLDEICSRQKLTPETLIEALLNHCEVNPELMDRVIADAKVRYKLRKGAGVKKRAIAMRKHS